MLLAILQLKSAQSVEITAMGTQPPVTLSALPQWSSTNPTTTLCVQISQTVLVSSAHNVDLTAIPIPTATSKQDLMDSLKSAQ